MDERKLQLKNQRKRYLKQRRRAIWFWNVLWWLFLVLLMLEAGLMGYMVFRKITPDQIMGILSPLKNIAVVQSCAMFMLRHIRWFVLGFGGLFLLVWVLRCCVCAKTRLYDSYLDYRTLKNTMKAERQEWKYR